MLNLNVSTYFVVITLETFSPVKKTKASKTQGAVSNFNKLTESYSGKITSLGYCQGTMLGEVMFIHVSTRTVSQYHSGVKT